jgi:hypothetical protein
MSYADESFFGEQRCQWCGVTLYEGAKQENIVTCEQAYGTPCRPAQQYIFELQQRYEDHPDYIDESQEGE